jgi:hypothetical protein
MCSHPNGETCLSKWSGMLRPFRRMCSVRNAANHKVEARGAERLAVKGPVANIAPLVKKDSALQFEAASGQILGASRFPLLHDGIWIGRSPDFLE